MVVGRLVECSWHILMSAQTVIFMIDVVENLGMSVEVMMASISFKIQSFELIDLFTSNFVVSVFFDFIYEKSASFKI